MGQWRGKGDKAKWDCGCIPVLYCLLARFIFVGSAVCVCGFRLTVIPRRELPISRCKDKDFILCHF